MFKKLKTLLLFFLFWLSAITPSYADNQSEKVWTDVTLQGPLFNLPNLYYLLDMQPRFSIDPDQLETNNVRGGLGYQIQKNLTIWAGYQWTSPDLVSGSNAINRLWEQLNWKIIDASSWNLTSESRFEQRYQLEETGCNNRYRQKLILKFPNAFFDNITPVISDEVIVNITKPDWISGNTFDQNRAFIGVDLPVTQSASLEVGYLNQYLWRTPENNLNNILYISLNVSTA